MREETMSDDETRAQTLAVMRAYQTLIAARNFDEWIELWADDGVCEFPYAPEGRPQRIEGKAAIYDYMTGYPERISIDGVRALRVHPMLDPRSIVAELAISGHTVDTGRPYNQHYVIFASTEGGKLTNYREYWNPLISIEAFGGIDAWLSAGDSADASEAHDQS
jgi:uncharacterized protein